MFLLAKGAFIFSIMYFFHIPLIFLHALELYIETVLLLSLMKNVELENIEGVHMSISHIRETHI